MSYHPDYPTPSAAAIELANAAKTAQKPAAFHPNPAKPLIDKEDRQTTPCYSYTPQIGDDLPGEPLPDGRLAIDPKQWQEVNEQLATITQAMLDYGSVHGRDTMFDRVARMLDAQQPDAAFEQRRTRAKLREPGFLGSAAAIRREMAQLYRESYAEGPDAARFFTRLTWMLDCLLRATQLKTLPEDNAKRTRGRKAGVDVSQNTSQTAAK